MATPKTNPEVWVRAEAMIEDGVPLLEIARTLHTSPYRLGQRYPEAKTPPRDRGELGAMARKFNALPDTLRGIQQLRSPDPASAPPFWQGAHVSQGKDA